jgi:amino acid adenylation domain-containing protein
LPDDRRALLARLLEEKAGRPLEAPASPGQERLWFAMRSLPGSALYNCPLTLEVQGPAEPEAIEAALRTLVARHEALRTTFRERDGELFQVIAPSGELPLERREAPGREAALSYASEVARAPFDLENGPLYRAALVRYGIDEWLILLNAHHLVSDGWSQGILLRELSALYRATLRGERAFLPPLSVRYIDFARWQKKRSLDGATKAFWARALADVPPLRLPLDFARPPLPSGAGERVAVQLTARTLEAARAVARREKASLFQVILTAFQMVLSRWCGQDRFVVGTPSHNRGRSELEDVVGFFVSIVPMLADFSSEPSLSEAFGRTRDFALAALAEGDPGPPAFVQVLFVWQESVIPELSLPEVRIRAREEDTKTSKFDLTLSLRPGEDGLSGHVDFASDLFQAATIVRMMDCLSPMIEALYRTPEARIGQVAFKGSAIRGPVLPRARATAESYARTLARCAGEPAVESPSGRLTFEELDLAASALAARFRAHGHREGEPVVLCLPTGLEAIVGIVAAWKRRSPYVPLDPSWPSARRERILEELGTRVRIGDGSFDRGALLDPGAERIELGGLPVAATDLAYIIYTSGSTGEPKGVMVSHRSLAHLDQGLDGALYRDEGRSLRIGIFGPLAFDTTVKQIVRMLHGDCLCPISPELKASPARLISSLREGSLDAIDLTPSWVRVLFDAGWERPLPGLVLLGGEPIDGPLWHELALRQARGDARFVNVYGPTEATVDTTFAPVDPSREPSIGTPLANTTVWLLDGDARPVAPGLAGEIAIGGDGLAVGYWRRPEETAKAFTEIVVDGRRERLYRTGDRARLRGDDQLVCLGRQDRQTKRNGQRVELDEIEAAIRSHPEVSEAAVLESSGRIVAWCVSRCGALDSQAVREHAGRRLPQAWLPDEIHFESSLPKNGSGKVAYRSLSGVATTEPGPERSAALLEGEPLRTIAELWAEILGAPPTDRRADFFAAGGDSLRGLRLLARLEKRFGVSLDVSMLAASPTPETLAAALAPENPRREPVVWFRRCEGERPPLVLLHATGGDVACYRLLASLLSKEMAVAGLPAPSAIPSALLELATSHAASLANTVGGRDVVLAGWSLGGVVALEVARLLRERGTRVPLLVLLDSRLSAGVPFADDPRLPEVSRKLLRLWDAHRPLAYEGEALLLRATAPQLVDPQVELWRRVCPRLAVVECAGDHHSMMRAPEVAKVAQMVSRAIRTGR